MRQTYSRIRLDLREWLICSPVVTPCSCTDCRLARPYAPKNHLVLSQVAVEHAYLRPRDPGYSFSDPNMVFLLSISVRGGNKITKWIPFSSPLVSAYERYHTHRMVPNYSSVPGLLEFDLSEIHLQGLSKADWAGRRGLGQMRTEDYASLDEEYANDQLLIETIDLVAFCPSKKRAATMSDLCRG